MNTQAFAGSCLALVVGVLSALGASGCNQALNATAQEEAAPSAGGDLVCSNRRECTYDIVALAESEADCACPKCPIDAPAIGRAAYEQRARQFSRVCGAWSQSHACPPTFCDAPPKLSCVESQCSLAGAKGGNL